MTCIHRLYIYTVLTQLMTKIKSQQSQQRYYAVVKKTQRLKKCRWNTFTLKLRLTTLRIRCVFVFHEQFCLWCSVCVKQTHRSPNTNSIEKIVCIKEIVALRSIRFYSFILLFFVHLHRIEVNVNSIFVVNVNCSTNNNASVIIISQQHNKLIQTMYIEKENRNKVVIKTQTCHMFPSTWCLGFYFLFQSKIGEYHQHTLSPFELLINQSIAIH